MMDIISDLTARLAVLDVPVLTPAQWQIPQESAPLDDLGRPLVGGGTRGLGLYLARNPGGYVQLYDPTPGFKASEARGVGLLVLHAVTPTRAQACDLAERIYAALVSSTLRPTPYEVTDGGFPRLDALAGADPPTRVSLTFQVSRIIPFPEGATS